MNYFSAIIKKFFFIVFSCLLFSFLVFFLTPSSWLLSQLKQQIPNLDVRSHNGSLWRGSATQVSMVSRGYRLPIGEVSWTLDQHSLVSLTPCLDFFIQSVQSNVNGSLCRSYFTDTIYFKRVEIKNYSATEVAALLGVEIQGKFTGKVRSLTFGAGRLKNINSEIFWQNAEFYNGEKWLVLGELALNIKTQGHNGVKRVLAKWSDRIVNDSPTPLGVDVLMSFEAGKLKRVDGYIQAQHKTDASLLDTLHILSDSKVGNRYLLDKFF
jgi:hypothetical protein